MIAKTIGPYQVLAKLGEGGMGEVYRARDAKLNRDVALKVLPDMLAADPDRLARFRREAQVLASLNHPNIAHIHGFEDCGVTHAIVMELVEGPTLAERIGAGAVPLADVVPIARQIADALEAAHEQGIVHRDLKPANIKVRDDGTVKVLDFGLAKALAPAEGGGGSSDNSPTLTARATQMGMIIGTAAYMAPEQARGRTVDRRADIWAFGVVLYEMLTGRRAFEGDDISITLASVLKEDVRWEALPADLPAALRRLLRRCLEKDPKRRLSAIGDARLELDEAESPADRDRPATSAPMPPAGVIPARRHALPWAVAALCSVGLVVTLMMWAPWRQPPPGTSQRLLVSIGADASMETTYGSSAILSPDGTTLAFAALQAGSARLFVRKLDQLQANPLPGTEGAQSPFFSPNGQWVAFFAAGHLKKISVFGGAAVQLCDATSGRGGTWAEDDTIVFTPASSGNTRLMRVSASGGTPAPFGTFREGAVTQRWPQALPGGRAVLYTEHSSTNGFDLADIVVAPLAGGAAKLVVHDGYSGRFVPSGPSRDAGHILYVQQGTLFAVPFDLARLETTGAAAPAFEAFSASPTTGGAQVAASSVGTLIYMPGVAAMISNSIDWISREGRVSALRPTPAVWANPRFSPDGQRLAIEAVSGKASDIWVYELARDTMTQLTFDPAMDRSPVWSADGKRIAFASDRATSGIYNLYLMNADGSGEPTRLTKSTNSQLPSSWHPNGKFLAFEESRAGLQKDVMILPMQGDAATGWTGGEPSVFVSTPASEWGPTFSPDGRWLAYASNELGNNEVFVRSFPGPGGKWRVSSGGGLYPSWSKTARELLFLIPTQNKVMFSPYAVAGETFVVDKPQVWSPGEYVTLPGNALPYDLHPDGKRLAVVAAKGQDVVHDKVVFVSNLFDYLRAIAPAKR